ncbi:acyl-CoA N-acyltransferase, partial [Mycena filopes]
MSRTIVSTELVCGKADQKITSECHRIRKDVFHLEQGLPLETEYDGVEDVSTHFLLRVTERDPTTGEQTVKSVGTVRGTAPDAYPSGRRYKLSRLAIDKEYRKHRFGRRLVESLHEWVLEDAKAASRPAEVECNSHIFTMGFYSDLGYANEGSRICRSKS